MSINEFIEKIYAGAEISFEDTMKIIAENYYYRPTRFSNGLNDDRMINEAGANEGSCKIFAFAALHSLTEERTLSLFGDYYRRDVLANPEGNDHRNIRNFIRYGWPGITFEGEALTAKST